MSRFTVTLKRMDGGINLADPSDLLAQHQTPSCQNVVFRDGAVHKRWGYTDYGSLLKGRVMLLDEFRMLDDTRFPMAVTTRGVYSYSSGTATARTNAALTGVATDYHTSATMLDQWMFSNGRDAVQYWDGSSATVADLGGANGYQSVQTTHIAKVIADYENRLHLFNTTEDSTDIPQRHRWSNLGDHTTWDSADYADLVEDPSGIVAAVAHADALLLFKAYSIVMMRYVGSAAFRYDTMTTTQGCPAPRTIAGTSDVTFFLGRDNVYMLAGGQFTPIGTEIWPEIRDACAWDNLKYAHAVLLPHRHEYRLVLPQIGTSLRRLYIYDYLLRKWSRSSVADLSASGLASIGTAMTIGDLAGYTIGDLSDNVIGDFMARTGRPYVLLGDGSGYVYQETGLARNDASNLDGHTTSAIDAWWSTPDITLGSEQEHKRKRFTEAIFEGKGQSVDVEYSTNGGASWVFGDKVTFTSATEFKPYHAYFDTYEAARARFRWRNAREDETFAVRSGQILGAVIGER